MVFGTGLVFKVKISKNECDSECVSTNVFPRMCFCECDSNLYLVLILSADSCWSKYFGDVSSFNIFVQCEFKEVNEKCNNLIIF